MTLSNRWGLQVDTSVLRALRKFPPRDLAAILQTLRLLPTDPFFGDIQKLKGLDNSWRRRIGAYRIFYKLLTVTRTVLVFRIERRTSRTYK